MNIHCVVQGCNRLGIHADKEGTLYCSVHWEERPESISSPCISGCNNCTSCDVAPKCAVEGCGEVGIVQQGGTGRMYCTQHAWADDRPINEKEAYKKEKAVSDIPTGMEDIGTRREHLLDLYELWSVGKGILESLNHLSTGEELRLKELDSALKLLWYHMQNDYDARGYVTTINSLPRDPSKI